MYSVAYALLNPYGRVESARIESVVVATSHRGPRALSTRAAEQKQMADMDAPAWETSKENVAVRKGGRDVKDLARKFGVVAGEE